MKSWVETANRAECEFPLQNLPYGVFSRNDGRARCATAIGDRVVDLAALEQAGLIDADGTFSRPALNDFMALGPKRWAAMRARLTSLLAVEGDASLRDHPALREAALLPIAQVQLHLPFKVSGYTDFYAGKNHAFNVGSLFRGAENALPPNWFSMPIAYNGRASTVVVSGTEIHRPRGQIKLSGEGLPRFLPSRRLDIELEIGAVVGVPSVMGKPVTVAEAADKIFGYVLLNDWSARDIQIWEYQPLGPFQAKAFATSISPWVVTTAALEPFRVATPPRERELLPYLQEPGPMLYDIELAVLMRPEGAAKASTISHTNYKVMYYSAPQLLAHHAACGCKMDTGDLLGSGTISGLTPDSLGSLLEMTMGGKAPITLDTGETRGFIEDGDEFTLAGWAQGDGYRIGFGGCVGKVLPAVPEPDWLAARS
jgi:fumarylacetoacetase